MKIARTFKPEVLPTVGSVFACLYWFIDSAIDTFVFKSQRLYIEDLLRPDSIELLARCQVVILMIALTVVAMILLRKQQVISDQLLESKNELEVIVDERTNDLRIKNIILEKEIRDRMRIEKELVELASADPLTGVFNRRKLNNELQTELNRNLRHNNVLSLIIFDIDKFKHINDKFGHNNGDEVLKDFTRLISENIRANDVFARWGGDEFTILLPETNIETARQIAEKLRILAEDYQYAFVGQITASFGVTQFLIDDNEATFINRADEALYLAKENGRNNVEVLPPIQTPLASVHAKQTGI